MNRIAAGLLIVGAVLAMNTMVLRDAMAEQAMSPAKVEAIRGGDVRETIETRGGSRVMALIVALRAISAQSGQIKG